ncbi:hypothetical protein [Rhodospirillum sp. A1_3_36]|uniref:hypothetical protein n=1 Tax=Rhodospirillum sp. A1_3_36 TaxID=3391666 RepID=UPI0039A5D3CA
MTEPKIPSFDGTNPYQKAIVIKWGLEYYYVPQEAWMNKDNLMPEVLKTQVEDLVKQGAVLAAIPAEGPTMGSSCYLVNLSRVNTKNPELI